MTSPGNIAQALVIVKKYFTSMCLTGRERLAALWTSPTLVCLPVKELLQLGELLDDRYRIGRLLGSGGYSQVFQARDQELDGDVAIKVLRRNHAENDLERIRFEEEARALRKLQHPHVVPVYDIGWHEGLPYIVMPRLRGVTLEERILEAKRIPVNEAEHILRGILAGLSAAHAAGILHRDIKPSNVFLREDLGGLAFPVLIDFGLARDEERENLTGAGLLVGTLRYMSPEQKRGEPSTSASDVYSAGLVAYETIAGAEAIGDYDGNPRALRDCGSREELSLAIERALDPDPRKRFSSAEEFLAVLDAPPSPRHLFSDQRIGVYALEEELGAGGMSVVWKALDHETGNRVALKFLAVPDGVSDAAAEILRRRFEREAKILADVRHPHLVKMLGVHLWEDMPFIALEYISGRTLKEAWTVVGWDEVLPLLRQVANALDFLHARGVVHRDVKEENILVRETKTGFDAVLLDLGVARLGELALTTNGNAVGTPGLMAPEVADLEQASPAADQWSFAAIIYRLLTGRLPGQEMAAEGDDCAQVMLDNARAGRIEPLSKFRPDLNETTASTIMRALSRDPRERFATCVEFFEALCPDRRSRGYRKSILPGAATVLVAVAVAFLWMNPSKEASTGQAAAMSPLTVAAPVPLSAEREILIESRQRGRSIEGLIVDVNGETLRTPVTVRYTVGSVFVVRVADENYTGDERTFVVHDKLRVAALDVRKTDRGTGGSGRSNRTSIAPTTPAEHRRLIYTPGDENVTQGKLFKPGREEKVRSLEQ